MKRLLSVVCVPALLLSLVGPVLASESFWAVKFRAGQYDGVQLSSASTVTIGAQPSPPSPITVSPSSSLANLAAGPTFGSSQWADSDNPPPYQFTLTLALGTGYSGMSAFITAWSPDTYSGVTGRSLPNNYKVNLQGNGVDVTWTSSQMHLASDPGQYGVGPVGFWYTPAEKTNNFASGDSFLVTIYAVPEPGGIAALGGGLIGFAGFALRRRRA